MIETTIAAHNEWRASVWRDLRSRNRGSVAPAADIRELGIYRGYRGIWVDKRHTKSAEAPDGVTIGVRHDGSSYADRLSETGLIYKFPETARPGHDRLEIEATRTAMRFGLPIFVVSGHKDAPTRTVQMAYVEACNDEAHEFLLTFVDAPIAGAARARFDRSALEESWAAKRLLARPNDRRFAFEVMERYGTACAVCSVDERTLLHSAHLRPAFAKGTDDPRNGLVLCANHHIAMDAGLWRADPDGLRVVGRAGIDLERIGVTRSSLAQLRAEPSLESLEWLWKLDFKHVMSANGARRRGA